MVEVLRPTSPSEAVALLEAHPGASILAGGTDLMLDLRNGRSAPELLIDTSAMDEGRGCVITDDVVSIGGLAKIRTLELDPDLRRRATAVAEAARVLGSVQIRTMATLGGNLCHATPSAEMPPPLLVHAAEADLLSAEGTRTIPLVDLFTGPGTTSLARAEMLVGVRFGIGENQGSCYLRQTVRWSMDLAGVGVAAAVEVDGDVVTGARVALGAVAPTPLVVPGVADALTGTPLNADRVSAVGETAAAAAAPISDARGSAAYRTLVVEALVPRALHIAYRRATGTWPPGELSPTNGIVGEETT